MVPYAKDADTGQNPVCCLPFPAYLLLQMLLKGKDGKVGGRKERVQQGTCQRDNELTKGRVGCGLGLDLVSAALPYLTRQLATASPREQVTPLEPGKFYVPLGTKVPEPTHSGNPKCHN